MVEISQLGITETALGARNARGADHVDETIGMLIDETDALLAGFWRNHHDDTDVILVGNGFHHLQIIIKRKVWDDGAAHAALYAVFEESLNAVVHDWVQITHQHEWKLHFILDFLQLGEEFLHRHSVLQSHGSGTLDNRTISQRITERDSYLNHIYPLAFHRLNYITGTFQSWASGAKIQAQKLAVFIVCK